MMSSINTAPFLIKALNQSGFSLAYNSVTRNVTRFFQQVDQYNLAEISCWILGQNKRTVFHVQSILKEWDFIYDQYEKSVWMNRTENIVPAPFSIIPSPLCFSIFLMELIFIITDSCGLLTMSAITYSNKLFGFDALLS